MLHRPQGILAKPGYLVLFQLKTRLRSVDGRVLVGPVTATKYASPWLDALSQWITVIMNSVAVRLGAGLACTAF